MGKPIRHARRHQLTFPEGQAVSDTLGNLHLRQVSTRAQCLRQQGRSRHLKSYVDTTRTRLSTHIREGGGLRGVSPSQLILAKRKAGDVSELAGSWRVTSRAGHH